jgi:DNA-binding response OmpR family regulator
MDKLLVVFRRLVGILFQNGQKTKKRFSIEELNDTKRLDTLKKECKICLIDDEPDETKLKVKIKNLEEEGYRLKVLKDLDDFAGFKKAGYNLLILDIQGVGSKYADRSAGWGLLKMIKQDLPHLVVVIYSGSEWSIRQHGEEYKLADDYLVKDIEYVDFRHGINLNIRRAFSFDYHLKVLEQRLTKEDISSENRSAIMKKFENLNGNKKDAAKSIRKMLPRPSDVTLIADGFTILGSVLEIYEKFK